MESELLLPQDRKAILDEAIQELMRQGFIVQGQTEVSASLVKPKTFSWLWAFVWFLLLGVGVFVYLIYYALKSDKTRYVEVREDGAVIIR